ncbi:unnamed protein product, partial [Rotaria sp. Silwood2]
RRLKFKAINGDLTAHNGTDASTTIQNDES